MTPTRGTRVYRHVIGYHSDQYTVWDEVDTNGGTPGVVWGVDEAEARERVVEAAREVQFALGDYNQTVAALNLATHLAALDAIEGADTEGGTDG